MDDKKLKGAVPLSDDAVEDIAGGTFSEINHLAMVMGMEVRGASSFTEIEDLTNYVSNIGDELKKYGIVSNAMLSTASNENNIYMDPSGNVLSHREVLQKIADARGIKLVFK